MKRIKILMSIIVIGLCITSCSEEKSASESQGGDDLIQDITSDVADQVGPQCGDGILQPGEACDEGPDNSDIRPNACRSSCLKARCGDGVTDNNEECDDKNTNDNDACLTVCIAARCGDEIIRTNIEACDDGKKAPQVEPLHRRTRRPKSHSASLPASSIQ